jgi:hypothetical protein
VVRGFFLSLVVGASGLVFADLVFGAEPVDRLPEDLFSGAIHISGPVPEKNKTDRIKVIAVVSGKCSCAPEQIQDLSRLMNSRNPSKVEFLVLHADHETDVKERAKYLKLAGLNATAFAETDYATVKKLKVRSTPFVIAADRFGNIKYRGSVSGDEGKKTFLADALEDLTAGRSVRQASGRGIGCAINPLHLSDSSD